MNPEVSAPEFSRPIDVRQCEGKATTLIANEDERAALSLRFGLVRIDSLTAELALTREDRSVEAHGTLRAAIVQPCAVSADDIAVTVNERLALRFVPETADHATEAEIEFAADDCDEIEYAGSHIDLGEAVAQSLALSIDPFLTGPNAEAARQQTGIGTPEDASPFAVLLNETRVTTFREALLAREGLRHVYVALAADDGGL